MLMIALKNSQRDNCNLRVGGKDQGCVRIPYLESLLLDFKSTGDFELGRSREVMHLKCPQHSFVTTTTLRGVSPKPNSWSVLSPTGPICTYCLLRLSPSFFCPDKAANYINLISPSFGIKCWGWVGEGSAICPELLYKPESYRRTLPRLLLSHFTFKTHLLASYRTLWRSNFFLL